ncbi:MULTISPECIES: right-handed parallel beta-helix repeat-containing protein [Rubrivivax]|uniref:Right-handed parallel beta-helix repeat-containing protein n=1 Tax=Rubrivivax benzoatilyticus TaxID=316997 RepID=A0ABX0HX30_9BURK|nr:MULTISPECIES: right-handed parallel beta-helix repeat-containing protein [Rubrivivax]EGJ09971.1 hypothetical protein RBXJA2T_06570 [Rubrivivax benzoatilyticus JA2 = ATCC BAA-35]NHK97929.1 right-handed parallel beta-helix repeat-containing protein [Rubrivivax benzoatilyticus]NHL23431.1 right-handed parallel beta-helix repeat-containing protein [Rubrivivax benzoatilyticus]
MKARWRAAIAALCASLCTTPSLALAPPQPDLPPSQVLTGEVLSTDFGIGTDKADNTEAINRWLAHCHATGATCRLAPAAKGALLACGIVVPGQNLVLQGPGMGGVKLTATRGCNRHFITVAVAPATGMRPMLRDLSINCANYANERGHCIHLPADTRNGYGTGVDLVNVYVDRAAEDAVHVERNRGAGLLQNTYLYHYKGTGLHLESSDWNCQASNFSGNYAPGAFADYGVRIVAGANNTFVHCRAYYNRVGVATEYASLSTPLTWIGGDLSNNAENGLRVDSGGLLQSVVVSGTRFTMNSMQGDNLHADILLSRNAGTIITGNVFQRGAASVPKYLIEIRSPAGPAIVANNAWSVAGPRTQSFATAVSNDPAITMFGGGLGSAGDAGANTLELLVAQTRDGRTPVRMTAGSGTARPDEALTPTRDFRKLVLRDVAITASNPATAEVATWSLPTVVLVRGEGPGSVTLVGAAARPVAVASTPGLAGLPPPALSVDRALGALQVTVTGLDGVELRWQFTARIQELQ